MRKVFALLIGVAFVTGVVGFALAQAQTDQKMPASQTDMKADKGKKATMHSASGTVKSATADSIVVSGKDKGKEAEWTFGVDDKTKIKKSGKSIMAKDIAAGDNVTVRYTDHDGKMTASSVTVRVPKKQAAAQDKK